MTAMNGVIKISSHFTVPSVAKLKIVCGINVKPMPVSNVKKAAILLFVSKAAKQIVRKKTVPMRQPQ